MSPWFPLISSQTRGWNGFSPRRESLTPPVALQDVRNSAPRRRVPNLINSRLSRDSDGTCRHKPRWKLLRIWRTRASTIAAEFENVAGAGVRGTKRKRKKSTWKVSCRAPTVFGFFAVFLFAYRDPGTSSIRSGQLDARLWKRHRFPWPNRPFSREECIAAREFVTRPLRAKSAFTFARLLFGTSVRWMSQLLPFCLVSCWLWCFAD